MQRHAALLPFWMLLAAVLSASVTGTAASSKPMPSLADFLAFKQKGTAAKAQSAYAPRQVEHVCLRATSYKNCLEPGGVGMEYFEIGTQCCDALTSSLGTAAAEVGTWKFSWYYFNEDQDEIEEAPGVYKLGEYSVQGYLNNAADSCGQPLCDQMVLASQGGIYYVYDAVLASLPREPTTDDSCLVGRLQQKINAIKAKHSTRKPAAGSGGSKGSGSGSGSNKAGVKSAAAAGGAAGARTHTARHYYDDGSPAPNLYLGEAFIFVGPMTVNSRLHDVKVTEGWFEYVSYADAWDIDNPISEAEAEGRHVVDPLTIGLQFYKPSDY